MLGNTTEQRLLGKMRWAGDRDAAAASEPDALPVIRTPKDLDRFLLDYFGVRLPSVQVCAEHSTPHAAFHAAYFAASPIAVWKASRGFGGKSFTLSLLGLTEALTLRADVNVLGGSGEQSQRILESMAKLWAWPTAPRQFLRTDPGSRKTVLTFGNTIKALMASQTSVRGPHPQRLRLDECLAVGTPVRIPGGWKNIEDMSPGDVLSCYHAETGTVRTETVERAACRGVRHTIRIVFSDGRSIDATPEHPILTSHGWKRADEATDAAALSFVSGDDDSDGPSRSYLPGVLPERTSEDTPNLSDMRGTEERAIFHLSNVLQRAAAKAQSVLFRLRGGTKRPRRSLSEVPSEIHGRPGTGQVRGGQGYSARGDAKSGGTPGGRTPDGPGPGVRNPGPRGTMGRGLHVDGQSNRDRSPGDLLARKAGGEDSGRQEAGLPGMPGLSNDRTSDGPDGLLVVGTLRIVERRPGLHLPVYDLKTSGGTYLANGIVVHNCDEMNLAILDSAMGQPMSRGDVLSQTVISSTHQYPDGTMAEVLKRAAVKGWPVHEWCFRETQEPHGWLPPSEVARLRGMITDLMWRTEYELQEPTGENRAIDQDAVRAMFTAGDLDGPADPNADYAHGADWARKTNRTVVLTFRKPAEPDADADTGDDADGPTDARRGPLTLAKITTAAREPWPTMVGYLEAHVRKYGGPAIHDGTGVGDVVAGYLNVEADAFIMVGKARADLLTEYVHAIEHGEILIPDDGSLAIRIFKKEHTFATFDDLYGAGHLPDTISAAALAYRAARTAQGGSGQMKDPPARNDGGRSALQGGFRRSGGIFRR